MFADVLLFGLFVPMIVGGEVIIIICASFTPYTLVSDLCTLIILVLGSPDDHHHSALNVCLQHHLHLDLFSILYSLDLTHLFPFNLQRGSSPNPLFFSWSFLSTQSDYYFSCIIILTDGRHTSRKASVSEILSKFDPNSYCLIKSGQVSSSSTSFTNDKNHESRSNRNSKTEAEVIMAGMLAGVDGGTMGMSQSEIASSSSTSRLLMNQHPVNSDSKRKRRSRNSSGGNDNMTACGPSLIMANSAANNSCISSQVTSSGMVGDASLGSNRGHMQQHQNMISQQQAPNLLSRSHNLSQVHPSDSQGYLHHCWRCILHCAWFSG